MTTETERLCEAALARIRQVEPHAEWSAPILALVAHCRQQDKAVEEAKAHARAADAFADDRREQRDRATALLATERAARERAERERDEYRVTSLSAIQLGIEETKKVDAALARAEAAERVVLGLSEAAEAVLAIDEWQGMEHGDECPAGGDGRRRLICDCAVGAIQKLYDASKDAAPVAARLIAEAERRGADIVLNLMREDVPAPEGRIDDPLLGLAMTTVARFMRRVTTRADADLAQTRAEVERLRGAADRAGLERLVGNGLVRAEVLVTEQTPNAVAILNGRCAEWRKAAARTIELLSTDALATATQWGTSAPTPSTLGGPVYSVPALPTDAEHEARIDALIAPKGGGSSPQPEPGSPAAMAERQAAVYDGMALAARQVGNALGFEKCSAAAEALRTFAKKLGSSPAKEPSAPGTKR